MEEDLGLRIELFQAENNCKLAVHKRKVSEITLAAIFIAIASALCSLVNLILGCPCGISVNENILLAYKIFNLIIIVGTLIYNLIKAYISEHIRRVKSKKSDAVNTTTQAKIDFYNKRIAEEQKKLKQLKLGYAIAYFAIAVIEIIFLVLLFFVK